jgi:hypothetical protein
MLGDMTDLSGGGHHVLYVLQINESKNLSEKE